MFETWLVLFREIAENLMNRHRFVYVMSLSHYRPPSQAAIKATPIDSTTSLIKNTRIVLPKTQ